MNFEGKIALVTGSSSGIGAATAVHFASLGANVIVTGRNESNVEDVAEKCVAVSPDGQEHSKVIADLSVDEDVRKLIGIVIDTYGRLDILVNNAGSGHYDTIGNPNLMTIYDDTFRLDVRSVLYLTQLAVPHLEKTKGCIINVSSYSSLKMNAPYISYCMAKSAVDTMTKCLAIELEPKSIRVNSVNPSMINTRFFINNLGLEEATFAKISEAQGAAYPLERVGEPEEVAKVIAFLASSDASFLTGVNLLVDGGALHANLLQMSN